MAFRRGCMPRALTALLLVAVPASARAQDSTPKIWTVTASAGLAMTSGNTDTSTVNAAYDVVYDPPNRNLVRTDGLLLRGKTEDTLSADRLSLKIRDEYRINGNLFVFLQHQYLRDQFKDIDYLLAPTIGLGYQLAATAATQLSIDASAGGVWEKNPGVDVASTGAVTFSQKLTQAMTSNATFTQSVTALWKTNDFQDALYTLGASIAASMSERTQLKLEALNTFKNRPPSKAVEKNDLAVLMAIVYKM